MIAIDIKMPKNCMVCNLRNEFDYCSACKAGTVIDYGSERPSWCPLKKVGTKVETVMGEMLVDEYTLARIPKEMIEQRMKQELKAKLIEALDGMPGAVVTMHNEDDDMGLRLRAVARVVIEDEV